MYDYRKEVIDLMSRTDSTNESLEQSLTALSLMIHILRDKEIHPHTRGAS
ncbi:hypothetical protein IMAU30143_01832 [Lactobacillus helveticus]|nr:hypothetical protein [Lactobacillus helveticus]NRO59275.1 hypothetical protein [Lactobacillus helveticus]NRO74848.1 hypothetical protein [Lactobacillus helveticus]